MSQLSELSIALAILLSLNLSCAVASSENKSKAMSSIPVPTPQVEPYKFEVGKIELSSSEEEASKPITITIPVKNIGSEANTYSATLKVNGEDIDTKALTLKPSENGRLEYSLELNNVGTYNLAIVEAVAILKVYKTEDINVPMSSVERWATPHQPQTTFCGTPIEQPFIIRDVEFSYPSPDSFEILDSTGKKLYSVLQLMYRMLKCRAIFASN